MQPTRLLRKIVNNNITQRPIANMNDENLLEWLGISGVSDDIKQEATYFTCLKLLAETLAKLPVKRYQYTAEHGKQIAEMNEVYNLLKNRPNPHVTPTTFFTVLENNRNHYGNGYAWIQRYFTPLKYGGNYGIKALYNMESQNVQVVVDNKGIFGTTGDIYYWYTDKYSGEDYVFPSADVVHVKSSYSFDGIVGIPVREALKLLISGSLESQKFMNNLYKHGLTARAVLQYTGDLSPGKQKRLQEKYETYTSGANNAGKFIPVPVGMEIKPLNITLADSQFFELKKYSALQIAAAFGIKPNQLNNYEKSSYNSSEMQNITFYIDTMLYIIKQYEEEFNYKLQSDDEKEQGYYYKLNENAILRTDSKTQKEILTGYVNNGIYKPNEARDILDMPNEDGGDILMCNGNYKPITSVGKEGENNA